MKITSPEMHTQYTEQGKILLLHSIYHRPIPEIRTYRTKSEPNDKKLKKNQKMHFLCALRAQTNTHIIFNGLTVMPYAFNSNVCIGFFGGCCVKSQFSSQSVMHYIRSYRWQLPYFEFLTAAFMWSMNFDCYINTATNTHKHTHASAKTIILFKFIHISLWMFTKQNVLYRLFFFVAIAGSGSQTDHIPNQPKYTQQRRIELQ